MEVVKNKLIFVLLILLRRALLQAAIYLIYSWQ